MSFPPHMPIIPPMPFFPPGAPMMIPPNVSLLIFIKKKNMFIVCYIDGYTTTNDQWYS
jgi:hypothetical protein